MQKQAGERLTPWPFVVVGAVPVAFALWCDTYNVARYWLSLKDKRPHSGVGIAPFLAYVVGLTFMLLLEPRLLIITIVAALFFHAACFCSPLFFQRLRKG